MSQQRPSEIDLQFDFFSTSKETTPLEFEITNNRRATTDVGGLERGVAQEAPANCRLHSCERKVLCAFTYFVFSGTSCFNVRPARFLLSPISNPEIPFATPQLNASSVQGANFTL
jgi:hypothetical protein